MRPVLRALACTAAVVPSVVVAVPTAQAAPAVQITYVKYDSPGADTGTNTSLNAEYVKITNKGSSNRSLTGWTLRDKTGYTYRFPTFTLKAGASVTVRTGKGTASSSYRYYNRTWYVWNNSGDTASLKNASGSTVDTCSWTSLGSGAKSC